MNILIIGQGIAGSCLAWELKRLNTSFAIADTVTGGEHGNEGSASRVAAGLVNPLTGRAFRAGWRQEECLIKAQEFYIQTEQELGGSWWQKTPIYRELETPDQLEIWHERQIAPESAAFAGPLFPWPRDWQGKGQAAYTRGSAVLHVAEMVNSMRCQFESTGTLINARIKPHEIIPQPDGTFRYGERIFTHIVWCTGWQTGLHPAMEPLKGRPSKGTILDLRLPELVWKAGILHFGHWLVHTNDCWQFGATYAWSWEHPEVPEATAIQELLLDLASRYMGKTELIRARSAVRPIIRRSQPVAGAIPGLSGQFVFSGLGSKGVTTAPWVAQQLAEHLVHGIEIPQDLSPAVFWRV